ALAELPEGCRPGCGHGVSFARCRDTPHFRHTRRRGTNRRPESRCKLTRRPRYELLMNTSSPWSEADYRVDLPHPLPDDLAPFAAEMFGCTWRTTLDQPGFALVRFAGPVGSRELRKVLFGLTAAFPARFVPERLGRFDQQVTSRFHRDGAPARS